MLTKRLPWILGFALLAGINLTTRSAWADARVVTGRTPATREPAGDGGTPGRWWVDLGGGVAAGGDLFQVVADQTTAWDSPRSGSFQARRYDVTLDEDVLFSAGMTYDLNARHALRWTVQWTQMDLTALANDSQYVTPVLWDRARILRGALLWEWRWTVTRLRPYLTAGLGLTSVDATADALDQTPWTPLLGVGTSLRMGERLLLRFEALDGFRQIQSVDLVGSFLPEETDLRERGPQHVVSLTAGLQLAF